MNNPLAEVFGRAIKGHNPVFGSIELTYACNLACYFCYNPIQRKSQARRSPSPKPKAPPLSFKETIDVLDQLKAMGVLYLTLTGGEAFLHPRFWDIAEEAKKRTFSLRIFTNGASITEEIADRLQDLGPYCLEFSLHGADPATAEALTQIPGSFDAQMRALEWLNARGIRVYLKCVVTRLVEGQLEAIKAIGDRFDYPVYFDPVLTASDDGEEYPLELRASDEGLRRLYQIKELNVGNSPFQREPGDWNCTVGSGTIHIDPYGNIQPCIQWKESIGNVRDKPILELWATAPLLQKVREINRTLPAHLKETVEDHAFCAHCPGLSQLRCGDPNIPDDQYLRLAKIRRELADADAEVTSVPMK
jgi:radical SAM protein with 4Fe4S-binding SPASM domain